jgi:hypothetical protein
MTNLIAISDTHPLFNDSECWNRDAVLYAALLRRTDQRTCPLLRAFCHKTKRLMTKCGLLKKNKHSKNDFVSLSSADLIGKTGDVEDRVDEVR